jgi:hypothetical protein
MRRRKFARERKATRSFPRSLITDVHLSSSDFSVCLLIARERASERRIIVTRTTNTPSRKFLLLAPRRPFSILFILFHLNFNKNKISTELRDVIELRRPTIVAPAPGRDGCK